VLPDRAGRGPAFTPAQRAPHPLSLPPLRGRLPFQLPDFGLTGPLLRRRIPPLETTTKIQEE
jgi:hypothetical protein